MKNNKKQLDINKIISYQRNRYPLLLIDKIIDFKPGKSVIAVKNFSYNEWYFPAHFDGEPNVPGFILIESMVQSFIMTFLCQKKYAGNKTNFYNLNAAKFRKKILPGDTLKIKSVLNSINRGIANGKSEGYVNNEFACSAEFTVTLPEIFEKFIPKKKK